jgi:hypothetical protein
MIQEFLEKLSKEEGKLMMTHVIGKSRKSLRFVYFASETKEFHFNFRDCLSTYRRGKAGSLGIYIKATPKYAVMWT